ncbi:MAG: hypothetical protein HC837_09130 [Chloroflexaceae bacterium]|nr:hypothetical protein [Chloroflexaceae bacterium]
MARIRRSVILALLSITLILGVFSVQPAAPVAAQEGEGPSITVTGTFVQRSELTIILDNFFSNEPIVLWQTLPDYTVLPIRTIDTNSGGFAQLKWTIDETFPVGTNYITARGEDSGYVAIVEFEIEGGDAPELDPNVTLEFTIQGESQGDIFLIRGYGFDGSEDVAVWLTYPDGTVQDLGRRTANQGEFAFAFQFGGLAPEGLYYITAQGVRSERAGIISLTLNRGDFLQAPEGAFLQVCVPPGPPEEECINEARQLEEILIAGSGFLPGETISLWVTLPTGEVYAIAEITAFGGDFAAFANLPAVISDTPRPRRDGLPVGTHFFSAYGQSSGLRAIAAFELLPGSGF